MQPDDWFGCGELQQLHLVRCCGTGKDRFLHVVDLVTHVVEHAESAAATSQPWCGSTMMPSFEIDPSNRCPLVTAPAVPKLVIALKYRITRDVYGLKVQPSGLRASTVRSEVHPVQPQGRRVRGTSTAPRLTLRLPAGLEPADIATASGRLRHAWGVHACM